MSKESKQCCIFRHTKHIGLSKQNSRGSRFGKGVSKAERFWRSLSDKYTLPYLDWVHSYLPIVFHFNLYPYIVVSTSKLQQHVLCIEENLVADLWNGQTQCGPNIFILEELHLLDVRKALSANKNPECESPQSSGSWSSSKLYPIRQLESSWKLHQELKNSSL